MTARISSVIGEVFGRLAVIGVTKNGKRNSLVCKCECGNESIVAKSDVMAGKVKSCGCLRKEIMTRHGAHKTRLYQIWNNMIERCRNPNSASYEYYGGRGIEVCAEWEDYVNFEMDMKESYESHVIEFGEKDTSLDRVDVDGIYCAQNCRWVNKLTQTINRRIGKNNTSGYAGVGFLKPLGKWRARATVMGKEISLGLYENKEDAIKARKEFESEREMYYDKPIY